MIRIINRANWLNRHQTDWSCWGNTVCAAG